MQIYSHLIGHDVEQLQNLRLWQRTVDTGVTTEGVFWMNTTAGDKRITFWDETTVSAIKVPRVDVAQTWTALQTFNRGAGVAPFAVFDSTKVAGLNADLLDGFDSSATAIQNKIPIYYTSGRLLVGTPVAGGDAVTKDYADAMGAGLNIAALGPVQAATTASIANLSSATVTHDGVVLVQGQYLLVKDNASPDGIVAVSAIYNGIYTVGVVTAGNAPLTRRTDADSTAELDRCYTYVEDGTINQGSSWVQTTNDPVIGTDNITWTKFFQAVAQNPGNGIDITGNIVSVKISDSTTYTAGAILYNGTTSTITGFTTAGVLQVTSGSAPTAATGTQYGLPYWATTTTLGTTAAGTSTTILHGNASGAPSWSAVSLTADVTGTLPIANGGTNATVYGANRVIFMNSGNTALSSDSNLTWSSATLNTKGVSGVNVLIQNTDDFDRGGRIRVTGAAANGTFFIESTSGTYNLVFGIDATEKWQITTTGIFQSNGAQTIRTSTGILTLATAAAGAINLTPFAGSNVNISLATTGDFIVNTNQLVVDTSIGNVGIGTTGPAGKLDVRDGNIILSDADVAHGMTAEADTTTFGRLSPISGTVGGLAIAGLSETDASALQLVGIIGTNDPTDSRAAIILTAGKKNVAGTSWTGLGSLETAFRIDNESTPLVTVLGNGNVGIGTTGPGGTLDVRGGTAASGHGIPIILSSQIGGASSNGGNLIFNSGSNGSGGQNGQIIFGIGGTITTTAPGSLTSESMRISNNGNVGIGTAAPTARIHVLDSGTAVGAVASVNAFFQASTAISTNSRIAVVSGTTGIAGVLFGDTVAQSQGRVEYDNNTDQLSLYSNSTVAVDITSTQGIFNYGLFLDGKPTTAYSAIPEYLIKGTFKYNIAGTYSTLAQILLGKETDVDGQDAGVIKLYTRVASGANTIRVTVTSTGLVRLANLTASTMLVCDANKSIVSGAAIPSGATAARVQVITITGDAVATTFTVTHNLGVGSTPGAIGVTIWKNDGAGGTVAVEVVIADIDYVSTNAISITFVSAPSANDKYFIVCVG